MDVHSTASAVSGNLVDDFLPSDNLEGGGVSLEWLSIFVEDCLNGGFTSQPPLPTPTLTTSHQTPSSFLAQAPQQQQAGLNKAQNCTSSAQVPSKAPRSKRRKTNHSPHQNVNSSSLVHAFHVSSCSSDQPPLLPQTYWLADSQLLTFPKKEEELEVVQVKNSCVNDEAQGPRRCTHCLSYKTPQWRAGPSGPKTLCNACGVRFKSGRLLPEYRPAKSPTFESIKHSNSHKKVMEMRLMATLLPSHTN